jgi:adhesin transport system membrane fusion protein
VFPEEVRGETLMIEQETNAYKARKQSLEDSVKALENSHALIMKEIALAEPLAARGLLSEVEILRMRRQANDLKIQMVERRNRYQGDANAELVKVELEVAQVAESLVGRKDVLERTTINAPVRGTVKNVRISTIGGVIQPGEDILEIVPLEDQLIVEGQIKPQDVAFLRPGLPATVKVSAYDFGIYGGLKGTVTLISPDTLQDDKKLAAGRPDATYYRVQVLTDTAWLEAGEKRLPIIPGMTATVEIRTGEKTILDYLLKPIFKAQEAFRER